MSYMKTNWVNGQAPAINADNLNKIEQGIEDAHEAIDQLIDITASENTGKAIIGDLLIQWGSTGNLTPSGSSANYSTYKDITFELPYKYVPTILTTPESAAATSEIRCTPSSLKTTGFRMNLIRSNTTVTNCMWVAIGQKA